jgi:hypothetical protein
MFEATFQGHIYTGITAGDNVIRKQPALGVLNNHEYIHENITRYHIKIPVFDFSTANTNINAGKSPRALNLNSSIAIPCTEPPTQQAVTIRCV